MAATVQSRLDNCSGRKLVSRLRFKPAHAVEAQEARREHLKAIEEGRGFQSDEGGELAPLPDTFNDRLKAVVAALEERVSSEAPSWLQDPRDGEELMPSWDQESEDESEQNAEDQSLACFEIFVEEIKDIVHSYVVDRAIEKQEAFHKRLTKMTHRYLKDIIICRDKLAPFLRTVDVTCPKEELYLYKPLERWDEDQREVMKEIIDERLRQLLTLHQLRTMPEEEDESEKEEVVEVIEEKKVVEAEEPDFEADQAARDAALAASLERLAKLQAENDEMLKALERLRQQVDAVSAEAGQLDTEAAGLKDQLLAPEQPIPTVQAGKSTAKTSQPPQTAAGSVKKARTARPKSVAKDSTDVKVVDEVDWEAQASADKEALEAELARLLKEAKEKNGKEWENEKHELLKRIAALEKELAKLEKLLMEQNASKISTELPSELSESMGELSVEETTMAAAEETTREIELERPAEAARQKKKRMTVINHPTATFPDGLREKEAVFDSLYTEAEERRERLEIMRKKRHAICEEEFKRTFQLPLQFGSVPAEGLFGSGADTATSETGTNSSAYLMVRQAKLEAQLERQLEAAGVSSAEIEEIVMNARNGDVDDLKEVLLKAGIDPAAARELVVTAKKTAELGKQLPSGNSAYQMLRQAKLEGELERQLLAAGVNRSEIEDIVKKSRNGDVDEIKEVFYKLGVDQAAAREMLGTVQKVADVGKQLRNAMNVGIHDGGMAMLSDLRNVRRVQSEGQLRVRLRGPLPALGEWLKDPWRAWLKEHGGRGTLGTTDRGSSASRKRLPAEEKPYDILAPTLKQVDHGCKLPTALSRMTSGSKELWSPAETGADSSGEKAQHGQTGTSCLSNMVSRHNMVTSEVPGLRLEEVLQRS